MFAMNPADFRHTINVYRVAIVKDEDNIPTKEEKLLFTTRARITNVRGDELQRGKGTTYKQEKKLYFRTVRSSQVEPEDIIVYNGKKYNITFVNDVEELGIYTEIKMELFE